jgi:hypothetical protein
MRPSAPPFIADFDSASAMLRATSNFLSGTDFPAIGQSRMLEPLARSASLLPRRAREQVFALGGLMEAISVKDLGRLDDERISLWVTHRYPERRYPAVMIGSSNGAAVHLCAALGVPWLPQTFLIPVRHTGGEADDPKKALEMGRQHAPALLEANPALQLHHMHDANQDRLMVKYMDYFRVKRRRLGRHYEDFLKERLAPRGAIIILECRRVWPSVRIGERHVFQHGALGGATEDEFMKGSERVEEYLERYDAQIRRWDSPEPTEQAPEAEWGFEPALKDDIAAFAERHGYEVKRLVYYEPEHLSPLVADFYRWWYRQRGLKANRLLVESFILLEPYWALRTGSVPFWMKFNMEASAEWIEKYLDEREPFDEIHLALFNHGVEAVGLPPIERWRGILARAKKRGQFVGVREDLFPRDFGSLARYYADLKKVPARYPIPGPLPLQAFYDFLERSDGKYQVELRDRDDDAPLDPPKDGPGETERPAELLARHE